MEGVQMSDRIKSLESMLREASEAYYLGSDPTMTDAQFDALKDELETIDPTNAFLSEVGSSVKTSPLQKVALSIPMGSLSKISWDNGPAEYATWLSSIQGKGHGNEKLTVQHKLDGLSIELTYKNGKFVRAVTRGDGMTGEDVTHNMKNACGVVMDVGVKMDFYVRGECVIKVADWKAHLFDMKNPRNAAAGITRRKSDTSQSKHLQFVAFDIIVNDESDDDLFAGNEILWKSVEEQIFWLQSAGFSTVFTTVALPNDVEQVVRGIQSGRGSLPCEIDGCVIKVNSLDLQEKLGSHAGRPYWARAWKFEASSGSAVINSVSWGVGTRGTIDPVAHITDCEVMGVTINNVTLHNLDEIARLGVAIGDEVEVVRAGDVIPKIVRVIKKGDNRQDIDCPKCPACGEETRRDGPVLRCSNMDTCSGVKNKRLAKWVSKRNIMYLGDSAIEKLVSSGTVSKVYDFYMLTVKSMVAAGIGEGMARKILAEIEKSLKCPLSDLLGSLSIDLLGRRQAQNMIDQGFGTLAQWRNISVAELQKLSGFGDGSKATRIAAGVKKNWNTIEELADILDVEEGSCRPPNSNGANAKTSGKLGGKSFIFTGAMSQTRDKMESLTKQHGGTIASGVSKSLSYLVIADPTSQSSKAKKARRLSVPMISEQQFMDMIR